MSSLELGGLGGPPTMRHVYANLLDFRGDPGETLPVARATVRHHAARPFGGWPESMDPRRSGRWRPAQDTTVSWRNLGVEGIGRLFVVVTDRSLDRDPTMRWREETQVGATAEGAFAYTRLSLLPTTTALSGSVSYDLDAPAVVADLVDRLPVVDAGRRLSPRAWPVGPPDVAAVATLVTHPGRLLPVIAVSSTAGGDGADPDALAHELAGLAHVVALSEDGAEQLGELIDADTVPRRGEVRLWWPGWTIGDGVHRSERWGIGELAGGGRPGGAVTRRLFAVSAFRSPEPDLEGRLVAGAARARVVELEQRLAADDAPATAELLEAWEHDLRELEEARRAAEEANEELARTRAELAYVLEDWNQRAAEIEEAVRKRVEAEADPSLPTTMEEALCRAAEDCPRLVVLPEAIESARHSPFIRPGRVYQDLVVLDELVGRWEEDRLPAGFSGPAIERGLDWVPDVSDTAKGQYRSDYERRYEGETIVLGPHLRYGDGPPERHCRVYLYLDRERRRIVVGHAGRHLRDASNR